MVTAEEVFELKVPLPDVVASQCRQPNLEGTGEIKLRRLVKEALRMRPSRIVVGEVRQEESLDLVTEVVTERGQPGVAEGHEARPVSGTSKRDGAQRIRKGTGGHDRGRSSNPTATALLWRHPRG